MKNDKSAAALKYFLIMCESMALDPDADCNPELKYIKAALTPDAKDEGGAVIPNGWFPMITAPKGGQYIRVICENGKEDICHWSRDEWSSEYGEGEPKCWHPAAPSQPQAVAEPIEDYGLTITGTGRNPITREIKTITLLNEENGETENFINRRLATPSAKDTTSEEVKLTPELYLICLCAWNNVAVDNTAMIKYTEENFGKAGTDGWKRVATALKAALSRGKD